MEPSLVTGKFKTQAGTQLFFRRWTPLPRSEGTIVLVHGLGEHSGRYVHVGDFFSRAGFSVFAFDLRGHGSSDGKPVVIIRYQDYLADLEAVMTYLNRPDPLILFGHSLGGQIVLAYGQSAKKPPSGYIVASPWLRLSYPPPIWLESLARALNVVCPAWRIPNRIGSGDTSRDQALLDSFPDLDKTYQFITVRTYFEVIKMGRKLMAHPAMDAPALLTHGEADPVTSIDATREFFERLVAPNKTFISYPEGRHELHNDLIRAGVLRDYLNWIVRRALRA